MSHRAPTVGALHHTARPSFRFLVVGGFILQSNTKIYFFLNVQMLLLGDGGSIVAVRVVQFQRTTGSITGSDCLLVKVSLSH